MATTDSLLPVNFSVGNLSVFTRRGSKKQVVRRKGGPSKKTIMSDPACANTKRASVEFGGCSSAATLIKNAMPNVSHLTDFMLRSRLHGICSAIIKLDDTEGANYKSILFSKGLHLLDGFCFNEEHPFDSVLSTSIPCVIDRTEFKATVYLPPISPGHNFRNPWAPSYYRFRLNLGVIHDWAYDERQGYQPTHVDVMEFTASVDSEWMQTKDPQPSQIMSIQLNNPGFVEGSHLLLSIGIEFGTKKLEEIIPVNRTGCGKILVIT